MVKNVCKQNDRQEINLPNIQTAHEDIYIYMYVCVCVCIPNQKIGKISK